MLGKAVSTARLGVLFLEAIAMIGAIGGLVYMTTSSGKMMDNLSAKWSEDMRLDAGEIATGSNAKELKAAHAELLTKAALPGEASRNSDRLHVGIVTFRNFEAADAGGFVPINLSVGKLSRAATLLISDGPIDWTITNPRKNQRAKLAFEGEAPVRASNMPRGFLAGTRIKALDANYVSGVDTLDEDRDAFCQTMKTWGKFFGVSLDDTHVSKIFINSQTPKINVADRGFKSSEGRVKNSGSAASLCKTRHQTRTRR